MLRTPRAAALAVLALASALAACGDDSEPAASSCVAYEPPASFDATAPASFKGDVLPILRGACSASSCHGSAGGTNFGVFLGTPGGSDDEAQTIFDGLRKPTRATAALPYVVPSDAKNSFLLRKIDGDQCLFDAQCTGGGCGARMPKGGAPLAEADRLTIRRWISQGAKND